MIKSDNVLPIYLSVLHWICRLFLLWTIRHAPFFLVYLILPNSLAQSAWLGAGDGFQLLRFKPFWVQFQGITWISLAQGDQSFSWSCKSSLFNKHQCMNHPTNLVKWKICRPAQDMCHAAKSPGWIPNRWGNDSASLVIFKVLWICMSASNILHCFLLHLLPLFCCFSWIATMCRAGTRSACI